MKPVLFPSVFTEFTGLGLGTLTDAVSCVVTEERNGGYELEMRYPVSGVHYGDIALRCIILAKANDTDAAQPFRIYRITKPMNGIVTIYAQHISYDLSGVPLNPCIAHNAAGAMLALKNSSAVTNPFTFSTDKDTTAEFKTVVPVSVRSILGGTTGSIIDCYGGEWHFDKFACELLSARGHDNGVQLRYGKNLTSLEQEENCAAVYTGVLGYYYAEDTGLVQGDIQPCAGTYDYTKILSVDLSDKWEEPPTKAQINAAAVAYINANKVGVPDVSLKVSFVDISKSVENAGFLQSVNLCDVVTVVFEKLGVRSSAKINKVVYDTLLERFTSVEIGDVRYSIADTIATLQNDVLRAPTTSQMQKAIVYATDLLTGAKGGHVVIDKGDDGKPAAIYIMDTADKATARKVWRYNMNGWGVSKTGINGTYELAAVFDDVTGGHIVADFITAGTLNAENVNVTNINGQNVRSQTIGNSQIASGAVQGSSGWGYQSVAGGTIGSYSCDGYCNGGISGGYEAQDVFAGRIYCNYLKTWELHAEDFLFKNQWVLRNQVLVGGTTTRYITVMN